ncbi:MAG: hypothetical protein GXP45_06675 [bacterium]|nr:hypothetical protein [bacterium]
MTKSRSSLSLSNQRAKYSQVVDFLNKINPRLNSTQKLVALYIRDSFVQKLANFDGENNNNTDTLSSNNTQIPHVDIAKVNQARLSRHNSARANKGLAPYQWDKQLAYTANQRTSVLAQRNLIDHSSHKRNLSDAYYDYNKIKNRFTSL